MARRAPKKLAPLVAFAYLRMSTDEQTLSPEAQRATITAFAARANITIAGWYEDLGMSGGLSIDERPGLLAALTGIGKREASVLLVAKHDRLARDEYTSAMIYRLVERAKGQVLSADGVGNEATPEGKLMRSIVAAFASYERALIRFRTKSALAVKKNNGERVGQVPFGFKVDAANPARLVPDDAEQRMVGRIVAMARTGTSYRAIADALTSAGVSPRGSKWHVTTIARIVHREAA